MARPKRTSTVTTKIFADRLDSLIAEKKQESGLNHKEIAAALGIGDGTLSEWCSDNKTASIDALPKIAEYFNVSADWLIGLSDVRTRNESIQAINESIGLSTKAILKLNIDKDSQSNSYIDFLNAFIEHNSFKNLAELVYTYLNHVGHKSEKMPLDLADMGIDAYDLTIDSHVFLKTILTEYFFNIVDSIK